MQGKLYKTTSFLFRHIINSKINQNLLRCLANTSATGDKGNKDDGLLPEEKYKSLIPGLVKVTNPGPYYQRMVRQEPGKVVLGVFPIEWMEFFYSKTGVTGFYTLLFTLSTYLVSYEIYVLEHEFCGGVSMFILCVALAKKFGKRIGAALDKDIDEYEESMNKGRNDLKEVFHEQIKSEELNQWRMQGQTMLIDAKRENVHLQLEAVYRQRLLQVRREVVKRINYNIAMGEVRNKYYQKNIVSYVSREVEKSLTPEFLSSYFNTCMKTLEELIAQHHKSNSNNPSNSVTPNATNAEPHEVPK